jgi:hypothetical protein
MLGSSIFGYLGKINDGLLVFGLKLQPHGRPPKMAASLLKSRF